MDIDLFSEIVKGLILDNDEVALPGLGTFVSGLEPSSFSDKGYTINPPYRRLSFRQRESGNVRLLAEFYAGANGTDYETSERILSDFISGLRTTLQTRKVVVFPGLGRLRATKENTFFFIADEDLDIYPYGVGLEPVSLKTHEETPEEVSEGVVALRGLVADPELNVQEADGQAEARELPDTERETEAQTSAPFEVVPEPLNAGPEALDGTPGPGDTAVRSVETQTVENSGSAGSRTRTEEKENDPVGDEAGRRGKGRGWRRAAIAAAALVGAAVLALGIFIFLSRVAPDFIDSLLYTPEELRIINY